MTIFFPLIIAFLITTIATPLSLNLIKKLGLLDNPKTHKHPGIIHKKTTPRGGGIPFFIGIALTGIFFFPLNRPIISLFTAGFYRTFNRNY